jgi:uncharacterized protein (DUF885 family)
MTRIYAKISLGLAFIGLAACSAPPSPAPAGAANSAPPHESLSRLADRYWDERLPPGNPLSPQFLADSLAIERRFLAEIIAVPRTRLDADARLNYDIFRKQREMAIEGLTYPAELLPLSPFDGMPQQMARTAADSADHPIKSAKDYANWQLKIEDHVEWTKQAIANMREGMRRGYTSPRVLMERMLPLLQGLGNDSSANVFYVPVRTIPQTITEPERTRLSAALTSTVKDKLLPAYRELHEFIQSEYLPRARTSVALSALPLGPAWYGSLVKRATGTQLTPDEIHSIGMAEVERIRARLLSLPASAPPASAPPAGPPPASAPSAGGTPLVNAYQELKVRTVAALPALFSAFPRADFEIRAAGTFSQATMPLSYQAAAPGSGTPPILYVNTAPGAVWPVNVETAGFLQEALPGRHFQSALQRERTDLPRFRRFGTDPAFVDGWALYAASLGEELGLYDDAAKRGALLGQLKCAAALVADTGIHAKNWTREQASAYLRGQTGVDDADANLMTDRLAAFPANALACKMGELKIQILRSRAQQVLGSRFDIREFHSEILKDGAMPLDILEAKLRLWMDGQQ